MCPRYPTPISMSIKFRSWHVHRAWEAVSAATRCRALVIFRGGRCLGHAGVAARGIVAGAQIPGPLCRAAQLSGSGSYLANMVLYPGRFEFFEYLPDNIQACSEYISVIEPKSYYRCGSSYEKNPVITCLQIPSPSSHHGGHFTGVLVCGCRALT